jgi:23S rRNA (pseudouridine1915-N3)-methyltransferase
MATCPTDGRASLFGAVHHFVGQSTKTNRAIETALKGGAWAVAITASKEQGYSEMAALYWQLLWTRCGILSLLLSRLLVTCDGFIRSQPSTHGDHNHRLQPAFQSASVDTKISQRVRVDEAASLLAIHQRVSRYSSSPTALSAIRANIRWVGRKNADPWLEDAWDTYATRLRSNNVNVVSECHKTDESLVQAVAKDAAKNLPVVLLDPRGRSSTSEEFARDFYRWAQDGGSRMTFVIGGAEGLPPALLDEANYRNGIPPNLLSLSELTFTHQFARLLLVEQIYRASEIRKGTGYHK